MPNPEGFIPEGLSIGYYVYKETDGHWRSITPEDKASQSHYTAVAAIARCYLEYNKSKQKGAGQ